MVMTVVSVSCNNSSENSIDVTETTIQTQHIDSSNELSIDDLPDMDFDGIEFNFLVTNGQQHSGYYMVNDIYAETINADPFNDAVYERNRAVEEKYNIKITQTYKDKVSDEVIKTVNAGDSAYDAIFDHHYILYQLSSQGYFIDFNKVPHLNLSADWWDQNSIEDFKFAGKNYFITGDISTLDDTCTRLCLFNKELIEQFKLESPYDLIRNNKWTFEKFSELVHSVSNDIDGNGIMEAGDQFGLISEASLTNTLFDALEGEFFTRNQNEFIFNADSAESFERYEVIYKLLLDNTCCAYITNWTDKGNYSNVYTYARSLFTQDKFLFHITGSIVFNEFRDMESDFGIVPLPKYTANQNRYYCTVDPEAPMLALSVTTPNLEMTGLILEAMAIESCKTVTPAFNETLLKRKYARDDESAEFLDLIAKSRSYSVARTTQWGNLYNIISQAASQNRQPAISDFAAIKEKTEAEIAKAMEMFEALE